MPDYMNYVQWCHLGFLAAMATVTRSIREDVIDKLDMVGLCASPNRSNVYYEVCRRTTMEADMEHLVERLRKFGNKADRVIVYCRYLDMCSDWYVHFHTLWVMRVTTLLEPTK